MSSRPCLNQFQIDEALRNLRDMSDVPGPVLPDPGAGPTRPAGPPYARSTHLAACERANEAFEGLRASDYSRGTDAERILASYNQAAANPTFPRRVTVADIERGEQ